MDIWTCEPTNSPDWFTAGSTPIYAASLSADENREMSPISLRIVAARSVPTPGIVVSVVSNCRSSSLICLSSELQVSSRVWICPRTAGSEWSRHPHIRNTKAAVSQFFDLASLHSPNRPLLLFWSTSRQLSQLGPGQLIRRGIFRQHSQGCLAKDGIKQRFILWKDTVQDRNGLRFRSLAMSIR